MRYVIQAKVAVPLLAFATACVPSPAPGDGVTDRQGLHASSGPTATTTGNYRCRSEVSASSSPRRDRVTLRTLKVDPYQPAAYPYRFPATWSEAPLRLERGLVRYTQGNVEFINPVSSAQYGIAALAEASTSRGHRRARLLSLAVATANDVLRMSPDGAMFPYFFQWQGPDGRPAPIPGYSAMAQGQMLSLLVRLYRATGEARWVRAAQRVFATITREGGAPPP